MAVVSRELCASVIVPVRDGREHLRGLLAALRAQTLPPAAFEVIVGDDGSTDGGAADLDDAGGRVRALSGPRRNAYAARNRAAAAASAPVLAFCDADCRPEPGWLEAGLAALAEADLVAGEIRFELPERPTIWTLLDIDTFKDHERQVRSANAETANLFVRRELFERLGGFDDSLPAHGDFEFVARSVASGARLAYAGAAAVTHPTRNTARSFLQALWIMNHSYAVRETRAGCRPEGLKLRSWVPLVQTLRSRRRFGCSLGLDRRRMAAHGLHLRARDDLRALPLMYVLMPYLCGAAQVRGWLDGRRMKMP